MQKQTQFIPKLALFITALIWGSTFFVMKLITDVFPTPLIMAVRFTAGSLALALVFFRRLPVMREKRYLVASLTTGLTQGIGYMLQTLGLSWDTTPGKSAFLTAAYCVFVPFLVWAIWRRRPSGWQVIAAGLCVVGIGLLSLNEAFSVSPGDFITLIGSVFFALNILTIGHGVQMGCDPALLTLGQLSVAGVFSWLLALFTGARPLGTPAPSAWLWVVLLGVVASGLCMTLQAYGQKHVEPAQASLLLSLESVFGVVFSVAFYGEALSPRLLLGFAVIFLAVVASETQFKFLRPARQNTGI